MTELRPPDRFPTWTQILLIFIGLVVLGLSACFGFLTTLNMNGGSSPMNTAFAVLFGLTLFGIMLDFGFVLWRVIRGRVQDAPPKDSP